MSTTPLLDESTVAIVTDRMNYNACQQQFWCKQFKGARSNAYKPDDVRVVLSALYTMLSPSIFCTNEVAYENAVLRIATTTEHKPEFVRTVLYEWYYALQSGSIVDVGIFTCNSVGEQHAWIAPPPPQSIQFTANKDLIWGAIAVVGVAGGYYAYTQWRGNAK